MAGAVAGARVGAYVQRQPVIRGPPGECWIGYDNEAGKGDHRHFGAQERGYDFSSPEQLMADFLTDVAAWQQRKGTGK